MFKDIKIFLLIFVIATEYHASAKNENVQCGRRPKDLYSDQIASGTELEASDWPWFAIVLKQHSQDKNKNLYLRDGVIISSTAVLTCGYCVHLNNEKISHHILSVQVGTTDYNEVGETGRQILPVEKVLVNPSYNIGRSQATSNLALLIVQEIVFSDHVQPICIWGPLYDKTNLHGKRAVVASFTSGGTMMYRLQPLHSVVESDEICVAHVPGHAAWLNEFNFCAGDVSGKNPDSAAAGTGLALPVLQYDDTITWYLHGVFAACGSDGKGTCDVNSLKMYTNVAPHYPWIYHNALSD